MRISGQSILAGLNPQGLQNGRDPATFQGLNPSGTEGVFGYAVPNLLIDHAMRNPPVPPGFWRGVNNNQNALYLECFMDETRPCRRAGSARVPPQAARQQPEASRRAQRRRREGRLGHARPEKGVYRGLSQHMGYGSYVAACAEVSVNDDGSVKIQRIVAATDPGHAVNPQQIAAQVEGSFAFGLSAMLHGEITLKDGQVEQENFDTYPVVRMDEMPAVETIVMPSGGFWGGVGEPTIFVAAPAVLNAIFAATGKRIRDSAAEATPTCGRPEGAAHALAFASALCGRRRACDPSLASVPAARRARRPRARRPAPAATARSGGDSVAAGASRPTISARRCWPIAPAQRPATVMDRIAKGFTDEEIRGDRRLALLRSAEELRGRASPDPPRRHGLARWRSRRRRLCARRRRRGSSSSAAASPAPPARAS